MRPWTLGVSVAALVKALWGIVIVTLLASAEPFWHQAILVLGGAAITSFSVVLAAMITSRRVMPPVEEVRDELHAHREIVEATKPDTGTRRRITDRVEHPPKD